MGNTEKLMNQIMELKFTSKSLQRQSRKCEKEEKSEKLKIKKAIEKGNTDGARIYAENAIRKRSEQMNYLFGGVHRRGRCGVTSLSTPEGEVNSLMQQVADDYGLEVSVGLPQAAAHAIPAKEKEKVDEDDLSRRLAELKSRG
ncbi:uncharacterized protein A4U43_C01F1280 [Asparagus officinalis]|uniref:Uncharacterized protein n=1 Tax=Asparagus officinalis TaxID=4686 RepID=A0A5P1FLH4_ASPOF|nr:uncharacterized protein A4U43_C01F1280 [Asparagus officinalis]